MELAGLKAGDKVRLRWDLLTTVDSYVYYKNRAILHTHDNIPAHQVVKIKRLTPNSSLPVEIWLSDKNYYSVPWMALSRVEYQSQAEIDKAIEELING